MTGEPGPSILYSPSHGCAGRGGNQAGRRRGGRRRCLCWLAPHRIPPSHVMTQGGSAGESDAKGAPENRACFPLHLSQPREKLIMCSKVHYEAAMTEPLHGRGAAYNPANRFIPL